ncbi:HEPN domain-containing protein, partial [Legionella sainthelensi]
NYTICFAIPLFKGEQLFQFDRVSIHLSYEAPENIGLFNALINNSDPINRVSSPDGLLCRAQGFCYNVNNDTFKQALSLLKVFIQQGLSKKLFIKNRNSINNRFSGLFSQNEKNIPIFYAYIKDELDGTTLKRELPDHLSCFLDKLKINTDNDSIRSRSHEEIEKFFQRCSSIAYAENQNIKSIKSAIEWAFDSYTYEEYDDSMSFLQVCFGLEALFTENGVDIKEEKASILSTLSLKCAYLISSTVEERKQNIDKIKEIYSLRSKLVHGRQNSLKRSEKDLLYYGRKILELSIEKEIKMNIGNIIP